MESDIFFFGSAFLAGLVIFFAPCTVPLIPAYLGFISGVTEPELASTKQGARARRRILVNSIAFVLGFSVIFITLGVLAGVAGSWVEPVRLVVAKLSGLIVIVLGLFMLGLFRLDWLVRERRMQPLTRLRVGNPLSSFFVGSAFAVGWTPCIGPILGSVLLIAGTRETVLEGALLLTLFSAGFGLPFVLLALAFSRTNRALTLLAPFFHIASKIGGVLLIVLGVFLLTGQGALLMQWLSVMFSSLGYEEALLRYL